MKCRKGWLLFTVVALAGLLFSGCGQQASAKTLKLVYPAWDSEIASTHVVKEVLEKKLGYQVEAMQVDAGPMWQGVSDGSADASVGAWLPMTHKSYLEKYKDKLADLGPNLDGAVTGLVVPEYMDISSIEDLAKEDVGQSLDHKIIGIEPGAGIMMATGKALKDYGLEGKWTLVESSSAAMAAELEKAYKDKKPIVVTGWTPHWMFAKMDLKYLDDPKKVYGDAEQIHTIVRKGLEKDHPDAYQFLDQFQWTPDDMAEVMVEIQGGKSPEQAAADWVQKHETKVNGWIKGIPTK
jgi:glycine betaine/proline transport system substrate-binding protein